MRRCAKLSAGLLILVAFVCLWQSPVYASDTARDYVEAIKLYNDGHYRKAAELFEDIARQGIINGKLFYNTGNAWFKAGNIGKAMLWYERALKRMPRDPDLLFNYRYVKGFLKDKAEQESFPVFDVLFFWKDLLGIRVIQRLSVIFFAVFWLLVSINIVRSKRLQTVHYIILAIALIFTFTALYDYYDAMFNKKAVIIADTAPVRSGLTESSTELFALHAGTRVDVDDKRDGYLKIRFSSDKIGWVKKDYLKII